MADIPISNLEYIRDLARDHAGLVIDESKDYLVESRLAPLLNREGLGTLSNLVTVLRMDMSTLLIEKVVEALVNNESSFFRDFHPFEALRTEIIPKLIESRRKESRLSIWSAGCAFGQEPYSVIMLIQEHFPELLHWDVSLHAMDISRTALERARKGVFSQFEMNRGLPIQYLMKYFDQMDEGWQVKPEIQGKIEFVRANLAGDWPVLPPPDLVLLRNVMLYMGRETKTQILEQVRRNLRRDGFLLIGAGESLLDVDTDFVRQDFDKTSCYLLP